MNSSSNTPIPVITIDGPSGVGKGTLAYDLSQKLQWPLLDSGAIYRALAIAADKAQVSPSQLAALLDLAKNFPLRFEKNDASKAVDIWLGEDNITQDIRTDEAGQLASNIAGIPEVRQVLLEKQRVFRVMPGLVADGRDMGTIVFPDAIAKIYLTATPEVRAERRFKQLKDKGNDANLAALLESIRARDKRDTTRSVAPLVAAKDALVIDSSYLSVAEVFSQVYDFVIKNLPR